MTKKESKKFKIDKYLVYMIICTILGFGVLFRLYNIFPFGTKPINLIDFDAGYVPAYYKLWDVLHLQSTMWFDWNLGTGLNGFGSLISNGMVSPLCWIIGVFPRSSIPYSMSFIYLIKMIFISVMTYIAIGKIFPKTDGKNKILFGLMYTFSGWTFMMSTNLLYLDAVAIYPLLVYAFKELLEKGKWKLYTVLLTITLLCSYYIAWLDLFFIIGTSGLALLIMKTDNKKEKAVKVLICTGLSLALSCIIFLPAFMVAKQSARMARNTSDDTIFSYFMDKSIYLFTLAIPFVLTVKQLFVKKDKRLNIFILSMIVFLFLGVVIEPINALWHTGAHSGFPFRYSYQHAFFTILVSIYYLNNNYKPKEKTSWVRIIIPLVALAASVTTYALLSGELLSRNQFAASLDKWPDYLCLLLIFTFLVISYIFALRNNKKVLYVISCMIFISTTVMFGYMYEKFIDNSSALFTQKIYDSFDLKNDGYNYMSDMENTNMNYPFILKVPSIHNRFHFIRQEQLDLIKAFDYGNSDTMIYSTEGSEFANALLQNKYFLSHKQLDEDYFSLIDSKNIEYKDEVKTVYYYQSKYNLNYLIPYNGNDYNEYTDNTYENVNNVYKTLFDGTKDIYAPIKYEYKDKTLTFSIKKGKKYRIRIKYETLETYKHETPDEDVIYERSNFRENYAKVDIKALKDSTFKLYASDEFDDIFVYEFDENEFKNFIEKETLKDVKIETNGKLRKYEVNLEEDTHILIPTNYDPNFIIKVNGEVVDYKCNLYNMISIDLKKGNNVIEIELNQKWLKYGIILTVVSLVVFLILYFINKKFRFLNCKIIVWPLFIIACLIFAALIIKVYILSWI